MDELYSSDAFKSMSSEFAQGISVQALPSPSAVAALAPAWLSEQSVQSYRVFYRLAQSLGDLDFDFTEETGIAASAMIAAGGKLRVSSGGAAVSGLVMAGGSEAVLSGGIDCGTLVSGASARQDVMSGGSALLTAVSAGGQQHIHSGADVSGTRIGSAGEVHLSNGVAVNAFHVSAHGSEVVSAGAQDAGAFVEGFQILRGGAASSASVLAGGVQRIEAGGFAADTEVLSGGMQDVQSSGSAVNTVVGSAGILLVSSGGAATNATVAWGGIMGVAEGGSAERADLDNGSVQLVLSGGSEMGTHVKPGSVQIVCASGSASGTQVDELYLTSRYTFEREPVARGLDEYADPQQGGVQIVLGDASVGNASVGAIAVQAVGCSLDELLYAPGIRSVPGMDGLYANPAAQALLTGMDASAPVMPGYDASDEEWAAWSATVQAFASAHPAVASGTVVSGGGMLYAGLGAKVSGASILCGSAWATPVAINYCGYWYDENWQPIEGPNAGTPEARFFPGKLVVASGGSAASVSVSGGEASVLSGGIVRNISICGTSADPMPENFNMDEPQQVFGSDSGNKDGLGFFTVASGGTAYGASALSGGLVYLGEGALASGGAVCAGGLEILDAERPYWQAGEGAAAVCSGTVVSGSSAEFSLPDKFTSSGYNSSALNLYVLREAAEMLASGYDSRHPLPKLGGFALQYVGASASAVSAVLSNGGIQIADAGGMISGTQISSGGTAIVLNEGTAGSAADIAIHSGGVLDCAPGVSATGIVQHSGGHLRLVLDMDTYISGTNADDDLLLLSGGTANGVCLFSGDVLGVKDAGSVTPVNGEFPTISAVNLIQHSGGNVDADVFMTESAPETGYWSPSAIRLYIDGTNASGAPMMLSGGTATGFIMYSGGTQHVDGGYALGTEISSGALQYLDGGLASGTLVHSGGSVLQDGGTASGIILSSGAVMTMSSWGTAVSTVLMSGALLSMYASGDTVWVSEPELWNTVHSGGSIIAGSGCLIGSSGAGLEVSGNTLNGVSLGAASGAYISSGTVVNNCGGITIRSGGSALGVVQKAGGNVNVDVMAGDSAVVSGSGPRGTFMMSGGTASGFTIYNRGRMTANPGTTVLDTELRGGWDDTELHLYGAYGSGLTVYGGELYVQSGAYAEDVSVFGYGLLMYDGTVSGLSINNGGRVKCWGGVLSSVSMARSAGIWLGNGEIYDAVVSGGLQNTDYGYTYRITVASGGGYSLSNSAYCRDLTLQSGASGTFYSGSVLYGSNRFDGAVVSDGLNHSRYRAQLGGSLTLGAGNRLSGYFQVNRYGVLTVAGGGNVLAGSMYISSGATVGFALDETAPGSAVPMLRLTTANTQKVSGAYALSAAKAQTPGTWLLASGLASAGAYAWKVVRGGVQLGTVSAGGTLTARGMDYALVQNGQKTSACLSVHAGEMLKAEASGGTLSGTEHSDIFANGAGNDAIAGSDGRDCAVWGSEAWGQDTVKATSGTMSIVFDGLSASEVTSSLAGSVMTFAKKADASQTITVSGWAAETHSVVFGGAMATFGAWKSAAAPDAAQISEARTEVWRKAGLAAA